MTPTDFSARLFIVLGEVAGLPLLPDKTIDIPQIAAIGEKFVQAVLANPPVATPPVTPAPVQ